MMDTVNGQIRVRAWPRKRGAAQSPAVKANNEKFALVQRASRYISPQEYAAIISATDGTPLLPRDIITMRFYNRMLAFLLPNGITLMPKPGAHDVATALDALSQQDGTVLVKEGETWVPRPYGSDGNTGVTVCELRTEFNRWINHAAWANWIATTVTHDPGGWADQSDWSVNPTLPGWYYANFDAVCNRHSIQGGRIRNGRGDYWATSPGATGPNIACHGSALVAHDPAWGPLRAQLELTSGTTLLGHDRLNILQIIGPLAPLG